jgi:hypothetical protein
MKAVGDGGEGGILLFHPLLYPWLICCMFCRFERVNFKIKLATLGQQHNGNLSNYYKSTR